LRSPKETYDIASFPITDLLVVPSHGMVVFADFVSKGRTSPLTS
jgi:hypothetical protein